MKAAKKSKLVRITATKVAKKSQEKSNTAAKVAEKSLAESIAAKKVAEKSLADSTAATSVKLLLYPSNKLPDLSAYYAFQAQYDALKAILTPESIAPVKIPEPQYPARLGPRANFTPGNILFVAEAATAVMSLFKTDYSFSNVAISDNDAGLLNAVAGKLKSATAKPPYTVYIPSLYNYRDESTEKEIKDNFTAIHNWAGQDVKKEKRADVKQAVTEAAALQTKLITADSSGNTPLAVIIKQAAIGKLLAKPNSFLVILQPTQLAGTAYTEKNIWSSLGKNPFYVMGGAEASYTVFNNTGTVVSSLLLPYHGGYHSVSKIEDKVNKVEEGAK